MTFKQIKLLLLFISALLIANVVRAELGDLNLLHQESDTQDSIVWPMLPNESLSQLAAKFYPGNPVMQRKFIQKTQRLNKTSLSKSTRYKSLTAITIPNLKSLSVAAGSIRRANRKSGNKTLNLSYNIKPKTEKPAFSLSSIPERLVKQYENLLERNTFLKVEIEKLNKRLVFLESKLGQLKLILDKSLSLPPKKKLKNLDAGKAPAKPLQIELAKNPAAEPTTKPDTKMTRLLDLSNKWLWLGLGLFSLLVFVGSYLSNKYKQKRHTSLVGAISKQKPTTSHGAAESKQAEDEALFRSERLALGQDTVVEDQPDKLALHEAKVLMDKGLPDEAIAHLHWTIRANPQGSIKPWMFLLDIFRQQNAKDEFEKLASEMHQNFNVMTPIWTQTTTEDIEVPQSLEEFSYIIEQLTDLWPDEKAVNYLKKLILDNRSGQRAGFSKAVVAEILLLIDVLEVRELD